jgi:hypothetical protein
LELVPGPVADRITAGHIVAQDSQATRVLTGRFQVIG